MTKTNKSDMMEVETPLKNGSNEPEEDAEDSEDSVPLKKLAAKKKRGKGTPATKVTMGRRSSATSIHQSTPEDDNNLDFEEEEEEKVVKTPNAAKKATTKRKSKVVTMGRRSSATSIRQRTPEGDNNLDFEDEEEEKVVKTTNAAKKATTKRKSKVKHSTPAEKGKPKEEEASKNSANNDDSSVDEKDKEDDDFDLAACCLCHCALDYSDRSAFFEADRKQEISNQSSGSEEEPLYFQPTDPYLPPDLYDASNALVYCDTCDRLYHQKCHFVPLMVVPRGKWSCLVCTTKYSLTNAAAPPAAMGRKKGKTRGKNGIKDTADEIVPAPFTKHKLSRMFKSPLPPSKLQQELANMNKGYHTPAEMEWEIATGRDKAILWTKTLTQTIPTWIQSQMSNLSQARTALETLTRTKQNRQHFLDNKASKRGSQELAQTLVKLTGAKWKMRQMVLNLEEIRANPERHIQLMQQWCQGAKQQKKDETNAEATTTASTALTTSTTAPPKSFTERVIFPFGQYPPRAIPRTPEMKEELEAAKKEQSNNGEAKDDGIPMEIVTTTTAANTSDHASPSKGKKGAKSPKHTKKHKSHSKKAKADDDSGVSLDDLVCAICLIGDATDENDLLLCDAQGCFRAYHMQCLEPKMTLKEVEDTEGEDWFCPLCSGMAQCVHKIQSYYMGEEWDRRRLDHAAAKQAAAKQSPEKGKRKKADNRKEEQEEHEDADDDDSLESWEKPDDVFPESKWQYETALVLRGGKRNDETNALLQQALGEGDEEQQEGNLLDYMSDGTDDVELDAHFDLDAFHEERKKQHEEMEDDGSADDDSSHSSQATLVDMSSVELKIGKDELNALSEGSGSDSDDDSHSDSGSGSGSDNDDDQEGSGESDSGGENRRARRSRRLRKLQNQGELPKNVGVEFDPSNIVQGKRRRKAVDYRKLNDALFGGLDAQENAKLDDKEDFRVPVRRKKKAPSSDEGSDNEGSDNDDEGSDAEQNNGNGKKNKKKGRGSRKRSRPASSDEDVGSGNEAENDDSSVEGSNKKKKAAKKPPAKRKRRGSPKRKVASGANTKPKKNGTNKSTDLNETNGKKAPKKQNGKKASGAAKKAKGSKAAGGAKAKKTKAKEPKSKGKATAKPKKK